MPKTARFSNKPLQVHDTPTRVAQIRELGELLGCGQAGAVRHLITDDRLRRELEKARAARQGAPLVDTLPG
jgi:hypothetical protein